MKKFLVIVGLYASRMGIFARYSISVEAYDKEEAEEEAEAIAYEKYDCDRAIALQVY